MMSNEELEQIVSDNIPKLEGEFESNFYTIAGEKYLDVNFDDYGFWSTFLVSLEGVLVIDKWQLENETEERKEACRVWFECISDNLAIAFAENGIGL